MAALGVIIFSSVRFLSKKSNQIEFFFQKKSKPNRNWFKPTGFGSIRFGFLGKKPVQTGLARFFRFFPVWLGFFQFRFGFFGFRLINRNWTNPARFFKILIGLIGFFHSSVFSIIFFPVFSVFFSPLGSMDGFYIQTIIS